jgi:hypothetical protein
MRWKFRRVPLLVSLVYLAGGTFTPGIWGCAGTLADPEEFAYLTGGEGGTDAGGSPDAGGGTGCSAAAAAAVPTTIFQPTCGVSGCHNPTTISNNMSPLDVHGLDLYSTGWASRLVNVPSVETPADDLVSSTDPENSYLLLKLKPDPPSGLQMPFGGTPLSFQQQACVLAWIESIIVDAGPPAATDSGSADSSQSAPDSSQSTPALAPDGSPAADSARGDAGPPTFTELYTTVFGTNGCNAHHTGGAAQGGLDLSTQAKAYANLVGVAAMTPSGEKPACSGDRVVAGNAMASLLYLKVSEAKPPCGAQMPLKGPYLSTAEQTVIENWINAGAKNN